MRVNKKLILFVNIKNIININIYKDVLIYCISIFNGSMMETVMITIIII